MSIEIQDILTDLPFKPGISEAENSIAIQSEPSEAAIAEGDAGPFNWMDLRYVRDNLSRLIDADQIVLDAAEAILVLSYPLEIMASRLIRPVDGKSFTRGELVVLIDETYREVYRLEANSQSSPTPPVEERSGLLNRPGSDGTFGIWGHDLEDLGIETIDVYRVDKRVWLYPNMVS